ncbi:hypothetical protein ACEPAI_3763 [Sanghuangporus weigelae]
MLALAHCRAREFIYTRTWRPQRCMSSTRDDTKDALRRLLRETAQPVAVVTSFYPFDGASDEGEETRSRDERPHHKRFHGATLSSFTSIALNPDPLVAFSLRIPSRMATSLKERMTQDRASQARTPNLVINLLSSKQADTAHHFARADLFPEPFRIIPHTLSAEGLPILAGALGALSCELISCMPLHNLCDENADVSRGVISELFISRVARVENVEALASKNDVLPLVYYRRKYGTVLPQ